MNIRKYSDRDKNAILRLWEACELTRPWNDPEKDIVRKQSFQPDLFLVGEVDGDIIASAMAGYDGHRGSVFYLAVSPNCQGLGYGRIFMEHIEELLMSMGCPKLNIVVRTTNDKVLDFYKRLGYKTDDVFSIGKRLVKDK